MKFKQLKKSALILMAIVLPLLSFGQGDTQSVFEKGNAFYAKGKYKEAADAYTQVINKGYSSAGLYYNLGNAYYRLDEIPSAILYYEKAHKLAPADEDINVNLHFANLKTTDKIDESPEFFIVRWWHGFILGFSVNTIAIWSIVLAFAGAAALTLYFFTQSVAIKKGSFYGALSLFFIAIILIGLAVSQINYFEGHKQAVIFSSIVNVKSGPVEQSSTLFVLHEGTKVNVLDNNHGWVKIKLANGNEGWIKLSNAKEI